MQSIRFLIAANVGILFTSNVGKASDLSWPTVVRRAAVGVCASKAGTLAMMSRSNTAASVWCVVVLVLVLVLVSVLALMLVLLLVLVFWL